MIERDVVGLDLARFLVAATATDAFERADALFLFLGPLRGLPPERAPREQAMRLDQNEPWARVALGLNLSTAGVPE